MGTAFVICMMPLRLLVVAVLLLAACSSQTNINPSPTGLKVSPSSSATAEATPILGTLALSLSAIQRLNPNVGYIAGWTGTALGRANLDHAHPRDDRHNPVRERHPRLGRARRHTQPGNGRSPRDERRRRELARVPAHRNR